MTNHTTAAAAALPGNSPLLGLLRLALGTSQKLWPALAVRAAHRLFGTPVPPRGLSRYVQRPSWLAGWQVQRWPFERVSLTVYAPAGTAPGPVAVLLHGWGGHAGQLLALAEALAAQGLQPVMVEMPAHGYSKGTFSTLPQFARALDYVTARLQQQGHQLQAVVAHSLGANAAAYALSRGLPAQRLVLLAPPASPQEYTRHFARMFGLTEATRAAMQRRIEAHEGVLMAEFEPDAVGPRIHVPTLVVHDRADRINRFADGVAYSRAIADARLIATERLGHAKMLTDDQVLAHVARFVA